MLHRLVPQAVGTLQSSCQVDRRLSPTVLIQHPREVPVLRMTEIRVHPDDRGSALLLLLRQRRTGEPTRISHRLLSTWWFRYMTSEVLVRRRSLFRLTGFHKSRLLRFSWCDEHDEDRRLRRVRKTFPGRHAIIHVLSLDNHDVVLQEYHRAPVNVVAELRPHTLRLRLVGDLHRLDVPRHDGHDFRKRNVSNPTKIAWLLFDAKISIA